MIHVWKSDLYRLGKSKLLYGVMAFSCSIALFLVLLMQQDIRVGISVFGDLTAFKGWDDIIRMGITYSKGLGIMAAMLISVFIGQEYQCQTWQHKWITTRNRLFLYVSKAALSSLVSAVIFLVYQSISFVGAGQTEQLLTPKYAGMMISGVFIYMALGSVISMLSMLLKSNTISIMVCLGYVLMSETWVSVLRNASRFSNTAEALVEWGVRHSIYGMSLMAAGTSFSSDYTLGIVVNALAIMLISTAIGAFLFRRYEL